MDGTKMFPMSTFEEAKQAAKQRASFYEAYHKESMAIKYLDKGFVRLMDSMGTDSSVVAAARQSYGKGTKPTRSEVDLIRYLLRNKHTSPFEMVEFVFHIKLPIYVMRQLVRHRTFSLNEYSMRYSEAEEAHFFDADNWREQDTSNKQGSGDCFDVEKGEIYSREQFSSVQESFATYQFLLEQGVAREQARTVLPVNVYTEIYWKGNLRNLFHFLKLRLDSHAQKEIREISEILCLYVEVIAPACFEAWKDYDLEAITLSALEVQALSYLAKIAQVGSAEEKEVLKTEFFYLLEGFSWLRPDGKINMKRSEAASFVGKMVQLGFGVSSVLMSFMDYSM